MTAATDGGLLGRAMLGLQVVIEMDAEVCDG